MFTLSGFIISGFFATGKKYVGLGLKFTMAKVFTINKSFLRVGSLYSYSTVLSFESTSRNRYFTFSPFNRRWFLKQKQTTCKALKIGCTPALDCHDNSSKLFKKTLKFFGHFHFYWFFSTVENDRKSHQF